jgi:hypothetical protein
VNDSQQVKLPTPAALRVVVGYGVRAAQANRNNGTPTAFIGCKDGSITKVVVEEKAWARTPRAEGEVEFARGGRYRPRDRSANRAVSALCPISDSDVLVGCNDGIAEVWRLPDRPRNADPRQLLEATVAPVDLRPGARQKGALCLIGRLGGSSEVSYYLVSWRRGPPSIYAVGRGDAAWREIPLVYNTVLEAVILARRVAPELSGGGTESGRERWLLVTETGELALLSCKGEPERSPSSWRLNVLSKVYQRGAPPILVWDYAGARFHDRGPDPDSPQLHDTLLLATDTGLWQIDCSYPDRPVALPLHLPGFAGTCNALALQRDCSARSSCGWILFANDEHARAHIFRSSDVDWLPAYTTNKHDIHVVRALGFPTSHGIDVVLAGRNSEARLMHYPLPE